MEIGHDPVLGVLWLRLDALPSDEWRAAFSQETQARCEAIVLHGHHVLCTATVEDQRRVARTARRIIGATNGRADVGVPVDPTPVPIG